MSEYEPTTWVEDVTPLSPENFNNMEAGITVAHEEIGTHVAASAGVHGMPFGSAQIAAGAIHYGHLVAELQQRLTVLEATSVQIGDQIATARGDYDPYYFLPCNAAAVSRTTYDTLFRKICIVFTGTSSEGSALITNVSAADVAKIAKVVPAPISGPGIQGTAIAASGTTVTVNFSVQSTGTFEFAVCPYGKGDGSTTFNLPDKQGRVSVGVGGAGCHADVSAVGKKDALALAARTPNHAHIYTQYGHYHYQNGGSLAVSSGGGVDHLHAGPAIGGYYLVNFGSDVQTAQGGYAYTPQALGYYTGAADRSLNHSHTLNGGWIGNGSGYDGNVNNSFTSGSSGPAYEVDNWIIRAR